MAPSEFIMDSIRIPENLNLTDDFTTRFEVLSLMTSSKAKRVTRFQENSRFSTRTFLFKNVTFFLLPWINGFKVETDYTRTKRLNRKQIWSLWHQATKLLSLFKINSNIHYYDDDGWIFFDENQEANLTANIFTERRKASRILGMIKFWECSECFN